MIKHDGHLRTRRKCKTEYQMQASVFYKISRVFPKVWSVLSQCNTRLRLLHLLYRGNVKNNKTRVFYVLYSDKTWVFDQSERAPGRIYIVNRSVIEKERIFVSNFQVMKNFGISCRWPMSVRALL